MNIKIIRWPEQCHNFLVQSISFFCSVHLNMQKLQGSQYKRVSTFHFFQHQTSRVGQIMTRLIKVKPTWGFKMFASDILLVFSQSCSKTSSSKSDVLTFGIFYTVRFLASQVVYTICILTIDSIWYLVTVSSHKSCDLAGGGREGIWGTSCWAFLAFYPSFGRFLGNSCTSITYFNCW